MQIARERSQRLKKEGNTLKERLYALKAFMTSTKMTIEACEYHLNTSILEYVKNRLRQKDARKHIQRKKEDVNYAIKCYRADKVKKSNPWDDIKSWNITNEIKAYLDPLKYDATDEAWPKNQKEMELLYMQLIGKSRLHFVMDEDVSKQFDEWVIAEESGKHSKKREKGKNRGNA